MESLKKNRYIILMFCYLGYYVTTNLVFAGAFEVYFDDTLVFSKLEKMRYPTVDVCIFSLPCCLGLETPLERSFKEERSREEEEELILMFVWYKHSKTCLSSLYESTASLFPIAGWSPSPRFQAPADRPLIDRNPPFRCVPRLETAQESLLSLTNFEKTHSFFACQIDPLPVTFSLGLWWSSREACSPAGSRLNLRF